MGYVLDACALIAYLRDEPGADDVETLLATEDCVAHRMNMIEVYYDFYRAAGEAAADQVVADLEAVGLQVREDMDQPFWREVGRLKATVARISLADCFAIALARRTGFDVVTCDRREFEPVRDAGICGVRFIR